MASPVIVGEHVVVDKDILTLIVKCLTITPMEGTIDDRDLAIDPVPEILAFALCMQFCIQRSSSTS